MRLAVYTDYAYHRRAGAVYAERAFALFLGGLAGHVERMVLPGRLDPRPGESHYRVPEAVEFVALPHYPSLARPLQALGAWARSLRVFWRLLDRVDAVWLLGPHPLALGFAACAALRGRRVALGVRQDLRVYARSRHPGRLGVRLAADLLEGCWRLLARRCRAVVVGPELADHYRRAKRLLELSVSLVSEAELERPPPQRRWDGELQALSVGRLETEKNPLLLADVLERLAGAGGRWRLVVCGEGPLEGALRERLEALGVAELAEVRGYVPLDGGLAELYRESHALLHVSWTEGLPQVLFESFAARLPVVATAVGGVPQAVGDAGLLVPPGDATAAARALERLAEDAELRERLVASGLERVRGRTLESESRRVAEFIAAP